MDCWVDYFTEWSSLAGEVVLEGHLDQVGVYSELAIDEDCSG